ncbi:MAG: insulinase family protein [Deltaproteobacteria bacterium]|nr:insulinase family protein [Deltaproteobacteria bacterium]
MTIRFLHEPAAGLGFVDIIVSFDIGAEIDPTGREGLAQLTMRLMRCGTARWTRPQVDAEVERLGAHLELGAGLHRVSLRARVIRESLEPLSKLLLGLVLEPAMREEDFAQAKRLLLAEAVSRRDDDQELAGRAFRRALFGDGHLGRPASGTVASLGRIERDDCVGLHRALCAQDTLVLGLAGDIDEAEARRLLLGPLESLPAKAAVVRPGGEPVPPRGRRAILVDKPERTQGQMYLGHLGPKPGREHHDAMLVSSVAFGGTFSARMMQEVRVKRGWSYGAYSRLSRSRTDDGWYLWTFPAIKDLGPCLALELDMLRALGKEGITGDELAFARGYLVGSSVFLIDTPADRVERKIETETLGFPADYYPSLRQRVEAVTLERAHAATSAVVQPDDFVVALLCTVDKAQDAVRDVLGDGATIEVKAFDDDEL